MSRGSFITAICVALTALCAAGSGFAQAINGLVTGTVMDSDGLVLPEASVVLRNETQGTVSAPVLTDETGVFTFPTVTAGKYTMEISKKGFNVATVPGIEVSPGSRVSLGKLTLALGAVSESMQVNAAAQEVQAVSGERSTTINANLVRSLPLQDRTFLGAAGLGPGVIQPVTGGAPNRVGAANNQNYVTVDGASVVSASSQGVFNFVTTEAIEEVRVIVSGYQAEYGRAAGMQIAAVTRSGTNQFHGSVYNMRQDSNWNANSKTNILNGVPKTASTTSYIGYSIGGPIGKPKGNNRLFFFHAFEFQPSESGNNVEQFRLPTALERAGDFSQTLDNNGNLYPYIKDPLASGPCGPANTSGCFADGGVLGKIPASRLYAPGLAIMNMYPQPNLPSTPGVAYNYRITMPVQHSLTYLPMFRVDYQATEKLRVSGTYSQSHPRAQQTLVSIPGFDDIYAPTDTKTYGISTTYTLNPTTFFEGFWGFNRFTQAPTMDWDETANKINAGLGDLPMIYPDAGALGPSTFIAAQMNQYQPPYWDGKTVQIIPTFSWGNRIPSGSAATAVGGPPNQSNYAYAGINQVMTTSAIVTKILGPHTVKAGLFYEQTRRLQPIAYSFQSIGTLSFANDTSNPLDTSFGFANAAIGSFTSYQQGSYYLELNGKQSEVDWFLQDSWRANSRLTLNYGARFVHFGTVRTGVPVDNFFPDQWNAAEAPLLYKPGCAGGVYPCSGTNRQALDPVSGQLLGPNSGLLIGTLVPDTGNLLNGIKDVGASGYKHPHLYVLPRFDGAWDVLGNQRIVLRGGFGLMANRYRPDAPFNIASNPPYAPATTLAYGQLQSLGANGFSVLTPPSIAAFQFDAPIPLSAQGNVGVQSMLPGRFLVDASYVGTHSWNYILNDITSANYNTIDLGTAFNPASNDPTAAANSIAGATSLAATAPNLVRAYQGYGSISASLFTGWQTAHSLQFSVSRRLTNGVQFGFYDTIILSNVAAVPPRYDHVANGSLVLRSDQAQAQKLLGDQGKGQFLKAYAVWALPKVPPGSGNVLRKMVTRLTKDWNLSTVWTGTSGSPYTIGYSYQTGNANVNLTGSPDFAPRISIVGNPGSGCSGNPYSQFNTMAFQGPVVGSVGLESGNNYLHSCFVNVVDLSIQRQIRLGEKRALEFRLDGFNALNFAAVTNRNTTLQLSSPNDPVTPLNLPYDANGKILPNRIRPNQAGFGAVTDYQTPRQLRIYLRFTF